MSFFKPEDFLPKDEYIHSKIGESRVWAAQIANAKLAAEGVRVYGDGTKEWLHYITPHKHDWPMTALLIGIEEIKPRPDKKPIHQGKLARMVVNALHALPTGVTAAQVDAIHAVINPPDHKEERAIQELLDRLKHREQNK